ncbi:PepSY domain-containing protein [Weeksellaceae bacterium TAE3-ERU29]|nr:PepSY domain-containing protein [Weeksellaceae bacterium TAE3-ERU29]
MGLSVGLIIFIISLTGSILVFQDEIENYIRHDTITMANFQIPKNAEVLPVSEMMNKVKEHVGESEPLSWITILLNKKQSYQFHYYDRDYSAWNYYDEFKVYKTAYVNP